MSRSLNKVQLIGNVGQEPDVRFTQDGRPIANLSIATSDTWTDKQGQKQEITEWHRVVAFGKLAEIIQQYVHKGSKLFIEGKLQTRKWTDNQGMDKYTTEIVINGFDGQMIMLDGRDSYQTPHQSEDQTDKPLMVSKIEGFDDKIPF
jgi:single-strand DNA-binding protein